MEQRKLTKQELGWKTTDAGHEPISGQWPGVGRQFEEAIETFVKLVEAQGIPNLTAARDVGDLPGEEATLVFSRHAKLGGKLWFPFHARREGENISWELGRHAQGTPVESAQARSSLLTGASITLGTVLIAFIGGFVSGLTAMLGILALFTSGSVFFAWAMLYPFWRYPSDATLRERDSVFKSISNALALR